MAQTTTDVREETLDEAIAAGFAKPAGGLPALANTQVSVTDAIITAQKVAVQRDEAHILQKLRILANAVGEEFFYRYPVKNNRTGQTDWIEGPSIKCANNVARIYGNCQVDTRIIDNGDAWIIYARFCDYESGFSYTRPFQQRKGQSSIKSKDSDRQLDIALQIGVSKAIRNVICNALETFTNFAFEEAKSGIVQKVGKNLDRYRDRVIGRLTEMAIDLHRVELAMGRTSKDWLASDVARIITQLQAIQDGMATIDETWPPAEAPPRPTREDFKEPAQDQPQRPGTAERERVWTEEQKPKGAAQKPARAQKEEPASPLPAASDTAEASGSVSPEPTDAASASSGDGPGPTATTAASHSERDLLGDTPAEDLLIPLPGRVDEFDFYARQFIAMINEKPGDIARLARIKIRNEAGMQRLKAEATALYDDVQRALTEARST